MISLKELLENHENENIEFKESFIKLSKDFWPTYSAFANTAGGYIVLGIAEPVPYQYEVSGVKNHKSFWMIYSIQLQIKIKLIIIS